jgi:hypothetical protein
MPKVEQSLLQMADANCAPRLEVTAEGTQKQLTHPVKKASAYATVEVLERGTTAAHLVIMSTIVNCVRSRR